MTDIEARSVLCFRDAVYPLVWLTDSEWRTLAHGKFVQQGLLFRVVNAGNACFRGQVRKGGSSYLLTTRPNTTGIHLMACDFEALHLAAEIAASGVESLGWWTDQQGFEFFALNRS